MKKRGSEIFKFEGYRTRNLYSQKYELYIINAKKYVIDIYRWISFMATYVCYIINSVQEIKIKIYEK